MGISLHLSCLLCSDRALSPLKGFEQQHLVRCFTCNFVFCQTRYSEIDLTQHYDGYGRDDYLSPVTIRRYEELLDEFELYREGNRLLDVGCGLGYFLEVASRRKWHAFGTEFTDKAIEVCRGKRLKVATGPLNIKNYEPQSFDVITWFEVIEHIDRPQEELSKIFGLLRPGGLLYLTTPNFNSLSRFLLGNRWEVICPPDHLCYYTPKTLSEILGRSGFKEKQVHTTGLSIGQIRARLNASKDDPPGEVSLDEKTRVAIEGSNGLLFLKHSTNRLLSLFGCGDTLKGYFEKPGALSRK